MSEKRVQVEVDALVDELIGSGSEMGLVGTNGSAAFADIDSGVAVAVMRNRFTAGDLTTVASIDRVVAKNLS